MIHICPADGLFGALKLWRICCCRKMMDTQLKLEAPWEEVKEKLKEINYDLTDEDLIYQPGNPDSLLKRLAEKMNRTPGEVKDWIESVSFNKGMAS